MQLDDERWAGLLGGYRLPYDPRDALRRLGGGDAAAWKELWEELHHQGDVGEASYATVVELVNTHGARSGADWNFYALAATVEEARHNKQNPPVPDWLRPDYERAWRELQALALAEFPTAHDEDLVTSLLSVLALSKGRVTLGRMAMLTEDELQALDEAGWG